MSISSPQYIPENGLTTADLSTQSASVNANVDSEHAATRESVSNVYQHITASRDNVKSHITSKQPAVKSVQRGYLPISGLAAGAVLEIPIATINAAKSTVTIISGLTTDYLLYFTLTNTKIKIENKNSTTRNRGGTWEVIEYV